MSGGYLVLLALGVRAESWPVWRWACGGTALLALLAWQAALRRSRAVADTPTSTIAAAAQGYVELRGRGVALDGLPVLAPLTHLPCLWYRYRVERRSGRDWVTESAGESDASFLIDDGTGTCRVDPQGAEVLPARTDQWTQGEHRHTQSLLLPGETVYVLGHFHSGHGAALVLDRRQDLADLLNAWKTDMPALRRRFDADGDGVFNRAEWEAVRRAAETEVQAQHRVLRQAPVYHTLGRPPDGRPFLVSSHDPVRLERRYRWWALWHALVFLAALLGLGWGWAQG